MPFRSKAQSRLMHAAAADPNVARQTGVPQSVAEKFVSEGHGKKQGRLPQHKGSQFRLKKEGKR